MCLKSFSLLHLDGTYLVGIRGPCTCKTRRQSTNNTVPVDKLRISITWLAPWLRTVRILSEFARCNFAYSRYFIVCIPLSLQGYFATFLFIWFWERYMSFILWQQSFWMRWGLTWVGYVRFGVVCKYVWYKQILAERKDVIMLGLFLHSRVLLGETAGECDVVCHIFMLSGLADSEI